MGRVAVDNLGSRLIYTAGCPTEALAGDPDLPERLGVGGSVPEPRSEAEPCASGELASAPRLTSQRALAASDPTVSERKAANHAILAVLLGAVGFAFFGLITGPLAIRLANRVLADDGGVDHTLILARVGRMLGYVALGLWAMATLLVAAYWATHG